MATASGIQSILEQQTLALPPESPHNSHVEPKVVQMLEQTESAVARVQTTETPLGSSPNSKLIDLVIEGGGVKGIGHAGVITELEKRGYQFANVAGTSAGAIVASLIAAGYSASELTEVVKSTDFKKFMEQRGIPLIGPLGNLIFRQGLYGGDYFLSWIKERLSDKNIHTFADLKNKNETDPRYQYKLHVVASDLSNQKMVLFPTAAQAYNIPPDELSVAEAVRMSMSIPFFFEPFIMSGITFVDGGLLSNFPIWIFDQGGVPLWPTFGIKFIGPQDPGPQVIKGLPDFAKAVVTTALAGRDNYTIDQDDWLRTIGIRVPPGIQATDFQLCPEQVNDLYQAGIEGAEAFFKKWDPAKHIQDRKRRSPEQMARIHRKQQRALHPFLPPPAPQNPNPPQNPSPLNAAA